MNFSQLSAKICKKKFIRYAGWPKFQFCLGIQYVADWLRIRNTTWRPEKPQNSAIWEHYIRCISNRRCYNLDIRTGQIPLNLVLVREFAGFAKQMSSIGMS